MAIEWPWDKVARLQAEKEEMESTLREEIRVLLIQNTSTNEDIRKLLLENTSLQKQILTLQQEKQQNQEQKVIRAKSPADVRRMAEHAFALDEVVE